MAWAADPELAAAVSDAQVETRSEAAIDSLLMGEPHDANLWYSRAWWSLKVHHDADRAERAGCYAAQLEPDNAAYHELCGDALILKGEVTSGSDHLSAASKLAMTRGDQCRLIWKIEAASPHPEVTPASPSPLVISYCQQLRQDASQRRMHWGGCVATCQAGQSACLSGQWSWGTREQRCSEGFNACASTCRQSYGSAGP